MQNALMPTYARLPVNFERGEGIWLWDNNGKRYLDALSGIAVCSLGHAHPAVTEALCRQAGQLVHTSNIYGISRQTELAELLTARTGMDNVFFGNSGAEANEAAIKIARLYGHQHNIETPCIVVMDNSFHGRTLATLSATGNKKIQAGFEPLVPGFLRVPFNDVGAIEALASQRDDIVAVLMEPVQGEGGINTLDDDYLPALRKLCDQHNWLLMLDEIQTGMCRTGRWLATHHYGVQPDVVTLAKALGNGVPIGACLASGTAASVLQAGNHGSTFGGNPLACCAALAVVRQMETDQLADNAAAMGDYLQAALRESLGALPSVKAIRGKGLMIGIELDRPCAELVKLALAEGLLINVTAERVIRLLPPLIIGRDEADLIVAGLVSIINQFQKSC
jgi:acetylornithine aminotransferase